MTGTEWNSTLKIFKTSTQSLRIDQNDRQSPGETKTNSSGRLRKDQNALNLSIPLVLSLGYGFVSFSCKSIWQRIKVDDGGRVHSRYMYSNLYF